MIYYENRGLVWQLLKVFQLKGSTYPKPLTVAVPGAVVAGFLRHYINVNEEIQFLRQDVLKETQAWAGFSVLVGFLIVFRTSQAYTRFWDGANATHMMRAEWFNACSALIAFCDHSKEARHTIMIFKHLVIRLFSMLHAAALADLEDSSDDIQAFRFELIDPDALDRPTLQALRSSGDRVELIFGWIQRLAVKNISTGVLTIPPPILSRSFQEMSNGMVAFNNAMQISYVPFPFPYAQTCDLLLVLHWLAVVCVTTNWTSKPWWASVFVFVQVFPLWSLNFIAVELENPFGTDPNDLDGHEMQLEMNRQLTQLLSDGASRAPELDEAFDIAAEVAAKVVSPNRRLSRRLLRQDKSFTDIFESLDNGEDSQMTKASDRQKSRKSRVATKLSTWSPGDFRGLRPQAKSQRSSPTSSSDVQGYTGDEGTHRSEELNSSRRGSPRQHFPYGNDEDPGGGNNHADLVGPTASGSIQPEDVAGLQGAWEAYPPRQTRTVHSIDDPGVLVTYDADQPPGASPTASSPPSRPSSRSPSNSGSERGGSRARPRPSGKQGRQRRRPEPIHAHFSDDSGGGCSTDFYFADTV